MVLADDGNYCINKGVDEMIPKKDDWELTLKEVESQHLQIMVSLAMNRAMKQELERLIALNTKSKQKSI